MESDAELAGKVFTCQRMGKDIPLCHPSCVDPRAYCKVRTSCPVHMLEKKRARKVEKPHSDTD